MTGKKQVVIRNFIKDMSFLWSWKKQLGTKSYWSTSIYIYIYIYKESSAYVGFTTTTLSRRLTMHLNDFNSIVLHLKNHSIPKLKFWKNLLENTTIIEHEIDKVRLHIIEVQHIKTKQA